MPKIAKKGDGISPRKWGTGIFVWLLLFAAALFLAQILSSKNSVKLKLDYTEFLSLVNDGKIQQVHFKGRKITGRFNLPYRVPISGSSKSLTMMLNCLNFWRRKAFGLLRKKKAAASGPAQ